MKFNCNIVDDLLPLYVEEICSEDSKAALEEHLRECVSCREKLARMKNSGMSGSMVSGVKKKESQLSVLEYAKKIKRHRFKMGMLAVLVTVFAACIFSLCFLTIKDMRAQVNPTVHDVEGGVYDLTVNELETTAEDIGQYVFFTNTTEIAVKVQGKENASGSVMLWNAENDRSWVQTANIGEGEDSCTFTNLSAAWRYRVTCDGLDGAVITVHENREIGFWNSFKNVLQEILNLFYSF